MEISDFVESLLLNRYACNIRIFLQSFFVILHFYSRDSVFKNRLAEKLRNYEICIVLILFRFDYTIRFAG